MSIPARILMGLMVVRLLMPPGLCICQQTAGAIRLLSPAEAELPAEPEHDEHHPGCPASFLSLGLGVQPAGPAAPDQDATVTHLSLLPLPAGDSSACSDLPASQSGSTDQRPRHLHLCLLLL